MKEDLRGGNYQSPAEFVKDVRLIFTNSRNFNTNKRSRVSSMVHSILIFYFLFFCGCRMLFSVSHGGTFNSFGSCIFQFFFYSSTACFFCYVYEIMGFVRIVLFLNVIRFFLLIFQIF